MRLRKSQASVWCVCVCERGQAAARSEQTSPEAGSGCAEELDSEYSIGFSGLARAWAGSVDDNDCVAAWAAGVPAIDTSTLAPPPWPDGWGAWLALGARRGSGVNSRICSAVSLAVVKRIVRGGLGCIIVSWFPYAMSIRTHTHTHAWWIHMRHRCPGSTYAFMTRVDRHAHARAHTLRSSTRAKPPELAVTKINRGTNALARIAAPSTKGHEHIRICMVFVVSVTTYKPRTLARRSRAALWRRLLP